MLDPAFPHSAEEVTLSWLKEALGAVTGDASIEQFSVDPVGSMDGFLSELTRIRLTYGDGAPSRNHLPRSVIAKFPSRTQDEREIGDSFSAYTREAMFYRHLSHDEPCNPPKHYYSAGDPDSGDYILLIEDLDGARFVKQMDGVERDDALDIVCALAEMHARYWQTDELAEMKWLPDFAEFARIYPPEIETGWPQFSRDFDYLIPADMGALFDEANAAFPRIVQYLSSRPATLAHCDPRIENVAFGDGSGPGRVRLYDWQLVSRGPGAYDLMYFMMQSIDTEVRRKMQDELVATYHTSLVDAGVTGYGIEELRNDMSTAACMIWGFIGVIGNLVHPDEKGKDIAERTLPRYFGLMRDLGAPEKLRSFR